MEVNVVDAKSGEVQKATVIVIYNGIEKSVEYNPREAVQALLQHAIQEFAITQNPHLLSLFTEAGAELADNQSAEAAGVQPGSRLLLRPSTVKGGVV